MNLVKTIAYLSTLIMGGIIIWANSKSNFLANAGKVAETEWGIVTLVDLYIGFLFIAIWMCFREEGFQRVAWLIGLFFLGWWAVLWTFIGMAIGTIIRQLKENV